MNYLQEIFQQFDVKAESAEFQGLRSGHINETFIVKTSSPPSYILQRINHEVFPNVPALVRNKVLISKHLRSHQSSLPEDQLVKRVLTFVPTKDAANYIKDSDGNYWNLTVFIEGCKNYLKVENEQVASEGGRLFGEFLRLTNDFEASKLFEVIPNFHSMSFRFSQFDSAFENAPAEKVEPAKPLIDFALNRRESMHLLENLVAAGELPLRVTHNDTKISNALFSADDKGLCVIDTDTVMQGVIHYDFGDAVRTICNSADEDERNPEDVYLRQDYFQAFAQGFIKELGDGLSQTEAEYLADGGRIITFIVGLRFLTDFLSGDHYFHIEYPEHNLVRAQVQFKLVSEIENNLPQMRSFINDIYQC